MRKNLKHALVGLSSVVVVTLGLSAFAGGNVSALETGYGVWVGDVEVTSSNKDNVLAGDPVNDGKVKFDSKTNCLSFDGAVITTGHEYEIGSDKYKAGICSEIPTLYMVGSVKISGVDTGIYAKELDIDSEGYKDNIEIKTSMIGIQSENTILEEAKIVIELTGDQYTLGISAMSDVSVSGADLTIKGVKSGIFANNNIFFNGKHYPKVNIEATQTCLVADGIEFYSGDISLKQTDKDLDSASAVSGNQITSNGPANIKIDSNSFGIVADDILSLDRSDVRINAAKTALCSERYLSISMGFSSKCVEINSGEAALLAEELDISPDLVKAPEEYTEGDHGFYQTFLDSKNAPVKYIVINSYDLSYVEATEPTLEKEGNIAYYQAGTAGDNKMFEDALGTKEITDKTSVIIPKLVALPDVTGKNYNDAETILADFFDTNGIDAKVTIEWVENSDPAKDLLVAETSPKAGSSVGTSTKNVSLKVYKESTPTVTPTATPGVTISATPTATPGVTISATPTVTPVEKEPIVMPDVTGMNYEEAAALLKAFIKENGLDTKVEIGWGHNSNPDRNLLVAESTPKAGEKIDASTKSIYLMVFEGYNPVPTVAEPTEKVTEPSADPKAQIHEFVDRIYTYVLDREPEAEGAAFWSDEIYKFNRTGAEVAQGFIFSPEFEGRNTTDEQFVTILYKTFFGRDPEADGMKYWLEQLSTGTMDRVTVANGFIYSQEWADTCAAYGIRSGGDLKAQTTIEPTELTYNFVKRMYTTAMARDAEEEGLKYWASELANFNVTGESVGAFFFLSEEMESFKLDDKTFLDRLYQTFMDRESDADGEAYWLGVMASGTTRADVVMGFTRSPEFTEKCIEARILPY